LDSGVVQETGGAPRPADFWLQGRAFIP
jgi:hypothetical protein